MNSLQRIPTKIYFILQSLEIKVRNLNRFTINFKIKMKNNNNGNIISTSKTNKISNNNIDVSSIIKDKILDKE